MRAAVGVMLTLLAGATIVWAGVQVQEQLARGEDLVAGPFLIAGLALVVLLLVALLSDSPLRRLRRRRQGLQAPDKHTYTRPDRK